MSDTSVREEHPCVTGDEFVPNERRILLFAGVLAFIVESIALLAIGISHQHLFLPHNAKFSDQTKFIEAQVFQMPPVTKLYAVDKTSPKLVRQATEKAPPKPETAMSTVPGQGKADDSKAQARNEEQNRTVAGPHLAPTHGPIAVFSPTPVIPEHLRNREIKTSVVIEFLVTRLAETKPRLISSSGNEELDAIAIATAEKWCFRPAEHDHQPVDARVRLRINFEVK